MSMEPVELGSFECHCKLCEPSHDGWPPDGCDELTVRNVEEHGWSVSGVRADDRQPGWACSVGVWHTARLPELCIFGLPFDVMSHAVNEVSRRARDGARLDSRVPIEGVLRPGPLILRPVHPSWADTSLFAVANRFYGRPLEFRQLVWPDARGRFPWEVARSPGTELQPMLWLDRADHPDGPWIRLDEEPPWPFADSRPDQGVITTRQVLAGITAIRGVMHWHDGTWEFLDDEPMGVNELAVAPLGYLLRRFPAVAEFADLPRGRQTWLERAGWVTTALRARRERP